MNEVPLYRKPPVVCVSQKCASSFLPGGGVGYAICRPKTSEQDLEKGLFFGLPQKCASPTSTSLIRKNPLPGPYSRIISRAICRHWGGGRFLMGEVPLYGGAFSSE